MSVRRAWLVMPWGLRQVGGVNEVVRRLAGGLRGRDGWDARVVVTREADRLDRVTPESLPVEYLSLSGPFDGRSRLRALASFVRRLPGRLAQLEAALRRDDCRIVNVHYPSLAALHFVLLRRLGRWPHRLVLSFHLSDAVQAAATRGVERVLWRLLLESADAIVTPTRDLWGHLLAVAPRCESRLHAIPNGVELAQFDAPAPLPDGLPAAWAGRPLIASVGGLLERKGHDDVIAALALLRAEGRDLALVIAGGEGAHHAALERHVAERGLADHVRILVGLPHLAIPGLLQGARVFALATRAETFCIAILEAGAARLPVVSTQAPGVVEVVEDGVTALLCPVGDVPALARAIARVLDAPDEAATRAAALRARIEAGLTWGHHVERYVDVLGA